MRAALFALSLFAPAVFAAETVHPGGFPIAMGPVAALTTELYNIIFIIIAVIGLGVAVGMGYIIWRFRREKNPTPATFSHNTLMEAAWIAIPAVICVYIAYISYEGLVKVRTMPADAVNVEVVAYQFGWDFYYPDASEDGTHVAAAEPTEPDPEISLPGLTRQAKALVIPAGRPVVAHITSQDVIHAFFVPSLGVKIDAMPGRINYVWFQADKPGSFLGQCAELCGSAHGEMFFRVNAVTPEAYEAYIRERRVEAGLSPTPTAESTPLLEGGAPVPVNTSTTAVDGVPVLTGNVVEATTGPSETVVSPAAPQAAE